MDKTNSLEREITLSEIFIFLFKIKNIILISIIIFSLLTTIKWFFISSYYTITFPVNIKKNNKNYPVNNYPINIEPSIIASLFNYVLSSDKYSRHLYDALNSKYVDLVDKKNIFVILQNKLNNTSPVYFFSDGITYEIDLRLKSTKKSLTNLELKNIELSINETINHYNADAYKEINSKIEILNLVYQEKKLNFFEKNKNILPKLIEHKQYLDSSINNVFLKIPINKKEEFNNLIDIFYKDKPFKNINLNYLNDLYKYNYRQIDPNKLIENAFLLNNIINYSLSEKLISKEKYDNIIKNINRINKEILELNEKISFTFEDVNFAYNALSEAQKKFYNNSFLPNLSIENKIPGNIVRLHADKYGLIKNILLDFFTGTFIGINLALLYNFLNKKYNFKKIMFSLRSKSKS